ncbi:protein-L-isoaspartate(D-aspartate) O-methyltransferase [Halomicroarcula sp. F13]|uniref:Protein-L-isoaspartate O-methyltransferase n=1 Tax=Haloarcula rubra TaxID=2487747 RepID=A0AAW4PNZ1_9EURY|nr:protein-L-isoaspartate(D-aspartate) O-methyltransferase [Halomicroarcula rubra]MBX0322885.1 protein-L-isoaspartate(D-aspartate) O-methyltransferase [Halomicroarcula rubra]
MPDWARARTELVDRLREGRVDDERVLEAMEAVPRHRFVPEEYRTDAYRDRPLPIGRDQTISAPHMVAIMAELLDLQRGDRVLEVGTGCGYHAAVTAELVGSADIYTVEYHDELARRARETLAETGYGDVSVRAGDGRQGWPEYASYDRAYLTCAASKFPSAVVEQVRPGGLLLAPVGGQRRQTLVRARRRPDGSLAREDHGAVRFVRLQ